MEHRRFLVDKQEISGTQIVIKDKKSLHRLKNVLRLKKGAEIIVLDGSCKEYKVILTSILKNEAQCEIINQITHPLPELEITLFQALLKLPDKMDLIIQKATELGVHKIVPIKTARSVADMQDRHIRWCNIASSAFLQSGQVKIPIIEQAKDFKKILENDFDLGLLFWEEMKEKNLKRVFSSAKTKRVSVIIGPEGGFDSNEVELAKGKGIIPVSLGNQILRSETASIVAISLVKYELE